VPAAAAAASAACFCCFCCLRLLKIDELLCQDGPAFVGALTAAEWLIISSSSIAMQSVSINLDCNYKVYQSVGAA
jgi:hypothetical protein